MQFLHLNDVAEWCQKRGVGLDENWQIEEPSQSKILERIVYAESGRSGREPAVAAECAKKLGPWEECLLWVVQWGVWPNSEDWPAYYGLRGTFGELRSLDEAPGHLFSADDEHLFLQFMAQVLENAWDAHVLPVGRKRQFATSAFVSHDGFLDLYRSG